MNHDETNALEVITDGINNLPTPIESSLLKAIGQLLGGVVAIPAAWLKRPAQAIDDVTLARSTVSAIVAKGVAENALKDPAIIQAATEIYLPTVLRKAKNRAQIARRTVEHTAEQAKSADPAQSTPPDDDWMNQFMRFAEDASSEQLQDLFSRILSGQLVRPGSFSLATLRIVSELDKSIADDFSLVWNKSVGTSVDYSDEFRLGEWFSRWQRLTEAGLMAPTAIHQHLPPFTPVFNGKAVWGPMAAGDVYLMVYFSQHCQVNWPHIEFTRVGRQIGSLLAEPDYRTNIRRAGQNFVGKRGVEKVELHSVGRPVESIV